jgi:hypothetical protein
VRLDWSDSQQRSEVPHAVGTAPQRMKMGCGASSLLRAFFTVGGYETDCVRVPRPAGSGARRVQLGAIRTFPEGVTKTLAQVTVKWPVAVYRPEGVEIVACTFAVWLETRPKDGTVKL